MSTHNIIVYLQDNPHVFSCEMLKYKQVLDEEVPDKSGAMFYQCFDLG